MLLAVSLGACSARNPAYDSGTEAGATDAGDVGTTSGQADGDAAGGESSRTSGGDVTSASTSKDSASDGLADTLFPDTGAQDEGETETMRCESNPVQLWEILVYRNMTGQVPDCGSGAPISGFGPVSVSPDHRVLTISDCGECKCKNAASVLAVDFGEAGAVPDGLPICAGIEVHSLPSDDGTCTWDGFVAVDGGPGGPRWLGANVLDATFLAPNLSLELEPDIPCASEACPEAGSYGLMAGGMLAEVGNGPIEVMAGSALVELTARTAHVDADCREFVSWEAVRVPG